MAPQRKEEMKIRIISDGTKAGTRIVSFDTGEIIEGISSLNLTILPNCVPVVTLEFIHPFIDLVAEVSETPVLSAKNDKDPFHRQ
jgi:hypothetical protein